MNMNDGSSETVEYWQRRLIEHRKYLCNPKNATAKAWAELSLAICLQKLRSLRSNLEQGYAHEERHASCKIVPIKMYG